MGAVENRVIVLRFRGGDAKITLTRRRGAQIRCRSSAPLLEHEKRRFGWATEPKGEPVADTGGGVELGALLLVVPPQIAVRVPGLEKRSATQAELDAVVVPGKGEIDA